MISFKQTTKAFSPSQQQQSLQTNEANAISAEKAAELYGEDGNVGDYLNKVTDPNYVKNKVTGVGGKNNLGKDDFLKLMLAQMKHQDPTTPLKSHEMAAQMAQFTTVEQLTNINEGIAKMGSGSPMAGGGGGSYDALGFIGKVASGDSANIYRNGDEDSHAVNFKLAKDAMDVKVEVKNSTGELVKTLELKNLKEGSNSVEWNGLTEDGLQARQDEYYFTITARGSNGSKVHAETKFEGKISGIKFSPTGPILMIGKQAIQMKDIKEIMDPTILQEISKDQKMVGNNAQDLKKVAQTNENLTKLKQAPRGNIDNVPMDRGLINKLEKMK